MFLLNKKDTPDTAKDVIKIAIIITIQFIFFPDAVLRFASIPIPTNNVDNTANGVPAIPIAVI